MYMYLKNSIYISIIHGYVNLNPFAEKSFIFLKFQCKVTFIVIDIVGQIVKFKYNLDKNLWHHLVKRLAGKGFINLRIGLKKFRNINLIN